MSSDTNGHGPDASRADTRAKIYDLMERDGDAEEFAAGTDWIRCAKRWAPSCVQR